MSEPENPQVPQPRRLVAGATSGPAKPRLLAGGAAGGLGNLKISMTPEQAAAMEKARAEFAVAQAAQEAEAARLAEEQQRYEAEQKRYEEEKRAYEEYLAAEQARQEEEARMAEEQRLIQEQQVTESAPQDPAAIAAQQYEQDQQYAQSQQAISPAPTPAVNIPAPNVAPTPTVNIPAPSVAPVAANNAAATPAVTPAANYTPGTMGAGRFGGMPASNPVEKVEAKPLWKRPILYIPFSVAFIAIGVFSYMKHSENKMAQSIQDKYDNFARMGADSSLNAIGSMPEDGPFLLKKLKEDTTNTWKPAVAALRKMLASRPELNDHILKSIEEDYNGFSLEKKQQLAYFVMTQKSPANPEQLRKRSLEFYQGMPADFKPDVLMGLQALLKESDIPMLISIITDPANKENKMLTSKAEIVAGRLMTRATDKAALAAMVKEQYNNSDEVGKYIFIRLMGKTGDASGLEFLKNILMDQNSSVIAKRNALKALGVWPDDTALPVLMKFMDEPFGKNADTGKFIVEELYRSLKAPGRTRDMKLFQPVLDFLATKKAKEDKLILIAHLSGNTKTDQWAIDLLQKLYEDTDDKVSYEAEKALESVKKREAPKKKEKAEESDDLTADPGKEEKK